MRLRDESEMKSCFVPWYGAIPKSWQPCPLKYSLSNNDGGVWGEEPVASEGTPVLRSTEVNLGGGWNLNDPARRQLRAAERYKGLLKAGDLVVTKSSGSQEHLGKTAIVTSQIESMGCCCSNFMQRLRLSGADPRYVCHLFNSPLGREHVNYFGQTTTGLRNLTGSILGDFLLPGAPPTEQQSIAAFLDRKTAAIDALVAKKGRLIELLQEKRQALITRAVTKGLDPNVPMKDSGVPWLGDLPAHWDVLRLKQLSNRISGRLVYQPAQYFSDDGVPFIMGNNVTERGISLEQTKFIPSEVNLRFAHHALREGDVVMVRVGAPGLTAVVGPEADGLNCGSVMIVRRNSAFDSRWLAAVMNSPVIRGQIDLVQYGAAQEQINITDAVNFLLPTPPVHEQQRIADAVALRTQRIDSAADKVDEQLVRLREYRQALITAAVTGKLDLSSEAA